MLIDDVIDEIVQHEGLEGRRGDVRPEIITKD
jgi:hypothetical protein